jgi:hypothetical protein
LPLGGVVTTQKKERVNQGVVLKILKLFIVCFHSEYLLRQCKDSESFRLHIFEGQRYVKFL